MNIRATLAADPDLGAGNVVPRLLAHGEDPDGPGLTFDTAVDGHPAREPLTLGALAGTGRSGRSPTAGRVHRVTLQPSGRGRRGALSAPGF